MSKRRDKSKARTKTLAWIAAALIHAGLIAALVINVTTKPKTIEAFDAEKIDVVKARTVDEADIKKQKDKIEKQERDKKRNAERERKRLEELRKQAKKEKQQIKELQDQQEVEKQKTVELEKQRKEILLKKQQEEAKRKKELDERKRKEKKAREKKAKAAAVKKRKETEERKRKDAEAAAAQKRLDDLLAEEERLVSEQNAARVAKQRTTTIVAKYGDFIENAIYQKLRLDAGTESWRKTKFNIKLSSRGDVLSVRVLQSSGSPAFDRNAENAVRQASPLPIPSAEEDAISHNELRNLIINIDAQGAG